MTRLRMKFVGSKTVKDDNKNEIVNFEVQDILDTRTGKKIAKSYLFGNAKQFRDANCKQGDIIELNASVIEGSDNIKIFNFYGLELVR